MISARYIFISCSQVIVENLKRAGARRVLCLGTPRIHEYIQVSEGEVESLLLDFDHRYVSILFLQIPNVWWLP